MCIRDRLYDVIDAAHVDVGHSGCDRMLADTSNKFASIKKEMTLLFLPMYGVCQQKKKRSGLVSTPILHSEVNSRCQIDLTEIDSDTTRW